MSKRCPLCDLIPASHIPPGRFCDHHPLLPTHGCPLATTPAGCIWHPAPPKGNIAMYDTKSFVDNLIEKRDNAADNLDALREAQYQIREAIEEIEGYVDEMNALITQLDELPGVNIDISVHVSLTE